MKRLWLVVFVMGVGVMSLFVDGARDARVAFDPIPPHTEDTEATSLLQEFPEEEDTTEPHTQPRIHCDCLPKKPTGALQCRCDRPGVDPNKLRCSCKKASGSNGLSCTCYEEATADEDKSTNQTQPVVSAGEAPTPPSPSLQNPISSAAPPIYPPPLPQFVYWTSGAQANLQEGATTTSPPSSDSQRLNLNPYAPWWVTTDYMPPSLPPSRPTSLHPAAYYPYYGMPVPGVPPWYPPPVPASPAYGPYPGLPPVLGSTYTPEKRCSPVCQGQQQTQQIQQTQQTQQKAESEPTEPTNNSGEEMELVQEGAELSSGTATFVGHKKTATPPSKQVVLGRGHKLAK